MNLLELIFGSTELYRVEARPVKAQVMPKKDAAKPVASFVVDGRGYKSTLTDDGAYESVKLGAGDYSGELTDLELKYLEERLGENLSIAQAYKVKYYLSEGLTISQMKAKHTHSGQTDKGWSERTIKKYTGAFSLASQNE